MLMLALLQQNLLLLMKWEMWRLDQSLIKMKDNDDEVDEEEVASEAVAGLFSPPGSDWNGEDDDVEHDREEVASETVVWTSLSTLRLRQSLRSTSSWWLGERGKEMGKILHLEQLLGLSTLRL